MTMDYSLRGIHGITTCIKMANHISRMAWTCPLGDDLCVGIATLMHVALIVGDLRMEHISGVSNRRW